jgi:hypothetical protein
MSFVRAVVALACLMAGPSFGHEGSWYPLDCCGGTDCNPVPCDALHAEENGAISYSPGDSHFVFERERIRPSHDERCHVCIHRNSPACVFTLQSF